MNRTQSTLVVSLLLASLALSGCACPLWPGSRQPVLANTQWTLVSLGAAGTEVPVIPATTVNLVFGSDGRASGRGGCNSYGGTYNQNGGNLTFGSLASTLMACPQPSGVMQQERQFLDGLRSTRSFQVQGTRLVLRDAGGKQLLRLERAAR